jgi:hypothetical protein
MKEQGLSTPTQMMCMRYVPYAEAIGSVLWPVMISCPDAAFPVSVLLQFIQNPLGGITVRYCVPKFNKRFVAYLWRTHDIPRGVL